MTLGEKINYYRKRSKLSQEELAERVGVSRQAVSKWELGNATPEVEKLLALARIFGVTTDELLSPEDPDGEPSVDPSQTPPAANAPPANRTGAASRFFRRYGHLIGYILAVCGVVMLYRGFILSAASYELFSMPGQLDGFLGNSTIEIGGQEILLDDPAAAQLAGGTVDTVANILQITSVCQLLAGIVLVLGGLALAHNLRKKGRED